MIIDLLISFVAWIVEIQASVIETSWPDGLDEAVRGTILGPGLGAFYALCYYDNWFPISELSTVVGVTLAWGLFMVVYRLCRWAVEVLPLT